MPPDGLHHYLQLPLDHADPSLGSWTGFYILSPGFRPGGPVVFFILDAQQEQAHPEPYLPWFAERFSDIPYVIAGVRGSSPNLLPEVFKPDGKPDYGAAFRLYSSWQQVRDLELMRRDMQAKGLLPADGKIAIYGRSGGAVLAQQFLDRYGARVRRALLDPALNYRLIRKVFKWPGELAARVRIYEVLQEDLKDYVLRGGRPVNLLYEWAADLLANLLELEAAGQVAPPDLALRRSAYGGEVLVLAGTRDFDFDVRTARRIQASYSNSKLALVATGHTLSGPDAGYYRGLRKAFLAGGFVSPGFLRLYRDRRQLNR